MGDLLLIRHGETAWSAAHWHTSHTEVELTPRGRRQATALGDALGGRHYAAVLSSPRRRALITAELAGLAVTRVEPELTEWDYGEYEGRTTAEIRRGRAGWDVWTDGCPGGESPAEVSDRVDRCLALAEGLSHGGDVAIFGHAHNLRVMGARWIGLPAAAGGRLRLDTAGVCVLGYEHGERVLLRWNQPVSEGA